MVVGVVGVSWVWGISSFGERRGEERKDEGEVEEGRMGRGEV